MVRYVLEEIPRSGPLQFGELIISPFTSWSRHYDRIIQILMMHS